MEQHRNGQQAKRFRPLGCDAGQLGSLNRDPEEKTPKAIAENKALIFSSFFFSIFWGGGVCSPKVFVLVGVNEASITK